LENKGITEFEIFNAPNLKQLDLDNNFLGFEFILSEGLTSLEVLGLRYNYLSEFVVSASLVNLKQLNLEGKDLGSEFVFPLGLDNLEYLNLYYNDLSQEQIQEIQEKIPETCEFIHY